MPELFCAVQSQVTQSLHIVVKERCIEFLNKSSYDEELAERVGQGTSWPKDGGE